MATPGVKLLMKRHLDALNRLRRLGRSAVKLASSEAPMRNQIENVLAASGLLPEKQAEIYKKILLKATPVKPGTIPKESHEKAAIGAGSLTPLLTRGRYATEKAVRDAGPQGYRKPKWSAQLSGGEEDSGVPPDSSHAPGLVREAGRINPMQIDDASQKISGAREILKSAMKMPENFFGERMALSEAKNIVQKNKLIPFPGRPVGQPARARLDVKKNSPFDSGVHSDLQLAFSKSSAIASAAPVKRKPALTVDKGFGDPLHNLVESTRSSLEINDRIEAGARPT